MAYKTRLGGAGVSFDEMINQGFGIVTVMNVDVFNALDLSEYKGSTAYQIVKKAMDLKSNNDPKYLCTIDTLKVANAPQEGPSKTVTGGQFSNPLIKFGKSARLEMQDALGRAEAIEALGGGIVEKQSANSKIVGLHFGEDFVGPKLLVGDSFFIDQKSGQQVSVKIVFYQFLPDSIFNLTQDAEGDATVFDMNGDLLTTVIKVAHEDGSKDYTHGVFYSIIDPTEANNATPALREYDSVDAAQADGANLAAGQEIKVGTKTYVVKSITITTSGSTAIIEEKTAQA